MSTAQLLFGTFPHSSCILKVTLSTSDSRPQQGRNGWLPTQLLVGSNRALHNNFVLPPITYMADSKIYFKDFIFDVP